MYRPWGMSQLSVRVRCDMDLAGKVAVVTGSSRGIGRAIALALARSGASVVVNCRERLEEAEDVARTVRASSGRALVIPADVSIEAEVKRLFRETLATFARVDILVNNAAITLPAELLDISERAWDRVLEVNLKGSFLCSQTFGLHMLSQRTGCIVNVASTAAFRPMPRSHHYVASKEGLVGLTKVLALRAYPNNPAARKAIKAQAKCKKAM